jgi:5,10-methenyltetrahydrofolate synthetase
MGNDPHEYEAPQFVSSPCMLHELRDDGTVDDEPVQARDVQRWRKAERRRLIALRSALSEDYRAQQTVEITKGLDGLLTRLAFASPVISGYWPIAAEPDLRSWMKAMRSSGVRVALPVALKLGEPLVFRDWSADARMARGLYNIPYPADGEVVVPDIVLAPLIGFDAHCFRLGFGGGFFDRTLAALRPGPVAIGVGYAEAEIRTIYPQPHDVRMDWVVTGKGPRAAS